MLRVVRKSTHLHGHWKPKLWLFGYKDISTTANAQNSGGQRTDNYINTININIIGSLDTRGSFPGGKAAEAWS
jgi:hypothetical protein